MSRLLSVVLLLLVIAACGSDPTPTPTVPLPDKGEGVLQGIVSIGPLCPVEPCGDNVPNPYLTRSVRLTSDEVGPLEIPLDENGTFEALLPEGEYTVDVTDCEFLGCPNAVPTSALVVAGETSTVTIEIDTGIR